MAFDLAGNMTSLTDASNNTETWTRDSLDRVTADQTSAGTRTFQYDLNGNVTDEVDRNGRERQFVYDNLGQQTVENWIAPGGPGSLAVTHTVTGSGYHADTWQTIVLPQATGGTWTLSVAGATTAPIAYNATADAVMQAIEFAVTAAGTSMVDWSNGLGTSANPLIIDFGGSLAGSAVPVMVVGTSGLTGMTSAPVVSVAAPGHPGTDSEDAILLSSYYGIPFGTFCLSLDGHTTAAISTYATAATVEAAIAALPGVGAGNVFVTAEPGQAHEWFVRFTGALAGTKVDELAITGYAFPSYDEVFAGVSYYQAGGSGANDVQQIVVDANSGSFTLTYSATDKNGSPQYYTTPALPYNASATQVANALNALPSFAWAGPGNIIVTGSGTTLNPYVVTFEGEFSGEPMAALEGPFSPYVARSITTAYNADGQITSIGDQDSQYAFGYNGQGQQMSVDNRGTTGVPDVLLLSQYDPLGDRTSLSATVGGIRDFLNSYSFDTLGRMTAETQQGQANGNAVATKGVSFGYDPIGDITSIERYTNITQAPNPSTDAADTTLAYNNLGQLTSEDHSHNGTAIENLSWTFDTLGRVSTFSSNDGLATYGYDKASQVVSATYSGANPPPNFSTTYDPNGVRNATGDTVGPNNHLTSDGTFNFVYDNEGNLIKRTRISTAQANDHEVDYSWDYRNRLTDAYFYNNSSVLTQHIHYVYDVFDHLIERDVDPTGGGTYTQIAHYVWDISSSAPGGDGGDGSALGAGEGGMVLEFNGQQQLTNRYLNGPNTSASDSFFSTLAEEAVSSLTSPGTVTFDLNDNQGSVRNVVDANGNLLDHINYTFDGQVASESNPTAPHLTSYAGGFLDPATQMLNEYHRWLVLTDGFWASADPLGLLAGDANITRDVLNNFTNLTDRSGLDYIKHIPIENGREALFYVDEGFLGRDRPMKFIGIYDPADPNQTVNRRGNVVYFQDVVDEVHDLGQTTDDWDAWFAKNAKDFNAPTSTNILMEEANQYLPDNLKMSHGQRRERVEEIQSDAREGMYNAASAGAAVTRGFKSGAGALGGSRSAGAVSKSSASAASRCAAPRTFKSFSELKRELGSAGDGKVWHHIVEQRLEGRFGAAAIHNTDNVIPISREANQAIANYYSMKRGFTKGMTVREWLGTQSFAEQREFGLDILSRVLAGKPLP